MRKEAVHKVSLPYNEVIEAINEKFSLSIPLEERDGNELDLNLDLGTTPAHNRVTITWVEK